ncbi:MAG: flagellar brake protein [Methylococcaceae bacterium]
MDNLSDYLVDNPIKILQHLKTLVTEKCIIAVSFGENQSFLTAITDIDEKKQIVSIDCGPKEYLNKELLNLGIVNCKAGFKGIEVLFKGLDIKRAGKLGQPALSMSIPKQIHWIQRRHFYRVRSPLSKNSYCSITIPETVEENQIALNFKLFDLSVTGFSILSETDEHAKYLIPLAVFSDCKLVLNDTDTHIISFIVRGNHAINPNKPKKTHRIGCELLNCSAKVESALLRYMQQTEIEIKQFFN